MTWISLVCLLALTSSALGRSGYSSGYGVPSLPPIRDQTIQRPLLSTYSAPTQGYGQPQMPLPSSWPQPMLPQQDTLIQQKFPKPLSTQGYGQVSQGYGSMPQFDQPQPVPQVPVLTEADTLCRGQKAETVIPLENGRKFVVCLDESKGVEQFCPKGLIYNEASRRCERKWGSTENICVSQPCLNSGQCVPTESHYECQCQSGFGGQNCELDARVCQTQQPCGQAPDVRCQSFRLGAALQYICILQDGLAYGLNAQPGEPSPCKGVDGPQALRVTDKGFIMCDGERMFVESCPGGTIWDDPNKACTWPDMQVAPQLDQRPAYGQSSYSDQRTVISKSDYGLQIPSQQLEQPKPIQSYNTRMQFPQQFEQLKPINSFNSQLNFRKLSLEQPKFVQTYGDQQQKIERPKIVESFDIPKFEQPKFVQSYGGQQLEQPRIFQSFATQRQQFEQPKFVDTYGGHQQQDDTVLVKPSAPY